MTGRAIPQGTKERTQLDVHPTRQPLGTHLPTSAADHLMALTSAGKPSSTHHVVQRTVFQWHTLEES